MAATTKHPDSFVARPRVPGKKGAARKLRASGWIPAVAYGPSVEPVNLAVDPKTFLNARLDHGVAHIYEVAVEGGDTFKAIIKRVQRDAVSRELTHIDLYAVDMSKEIRIDVRIDLVGKPMGLINGGILQQILRRIEVQCLPGNIPSSIEVDVTDLDIGDTLHMSDLTLPQGVKATAARDEAVAIMAEPEKVEEPTAEGAIEGEAAAAEGAAPEGAAASAESAKEGENK